LGRLAGWLRRSPAGSLAYRLRFGGVTELPTSVPNVAHLRSDQRAATPQGRLSLVRPSPRSPPTCLLPLWSARAYTDGGRQSFDSCNVRPVAGPTRDEREAGYLRWQLQELRRAKGRWQALAIICLSVLARLILGGAAGIPAA